MPLLSLVMTSLMQDLAVYVKKSYLSKVDKLEKAKVTTMYNVR